MIEVDVKCTTVEYWMEKGLSVEKASEYAIIWGAHLMKNVSVRGSEAEQFVDAISDLIEQSDAKIEGRKPAVMKQAAESFETKYPEVAKYLREYNGNFGFLVSVKSQFVSRGSISDAQRASVEKCMDREVEYNARKQEAAAPVAAPVAAPISDECRNPTFANGSVLKISKKIAVAIAEEKGFDTAFRKVEVVKTHRETSKAILVTVKFSTQVGCFCGICGRQLTHPVSKATGIGPECADKMGITRYSMDAAKEVLKTLSDKLTTMGEVKTWIPRSTITEQATEQEVA